MGWKSVKEHYRIEHLVHVMNGAIMVGSHYMPAIIGIVSGSPKLVLNHLLRPFANEDLERIWQEMEADPETLRKLVEQEDTFERSIPVYTFQRGEIIEKMCEYPGWPNVTHDGQLMYENRFSTDRDEVVQWAVRNAEAALQRIDQELEHLKDQERDLRSEAEAYKAGLEKLRAQCSVTP